MNFESDNQRRAVMARLAAPMRHPVMTARRIEKRVAELSPKKKKRLLTLGALLTAGGGIGLARSFGMLYALRKASSIPAVAAEKGASMVRSAAHRRILKQGTPLPFVFGIYETKKRGRKILSSGSWSAPGKPLEADIIHVTKRKWFRRNK